MTSPAPSTPFGSPAALARFFLTAAIGITLDLWTKVLAFDKLEITHYTEPDGRIRFDSTTYQLIPNWLHFKLTANYGAVFGIGQGQRLVFLAFSIGAIAFLVYLFRASGRQRFYQVVLGMLMAGVLGNMYDRITRGYVRDMIYALPGRTWPGSEREIFPWIFNVADSLLCVGVGLMLIYSFLAPRGQAQPEEPSTESPAAPAERAVL